MRKTALLVSIILIFSAPLIHSQDDLYTDDPLMPDMESSDDASMDDDLFAGMDMEPGPEGAIDESELDAGDEDLFAGMDIGAGSEGTTDAGEPDAGDEDLFAGMDMGDMGSEDALAGAGAGPGLSLEQAGEGIPEEKAQSTLPADKPKQKKKSKPKTLLSAPLTDAVYTKDGAVKWFRNLRDYMNWKVKASSEGAGSTAEMLADNEVSTAWISKNSSDGVGEKITMKFDEINFAPIYEKNKKSVTVNSVKILNGYCDSREKFEKYNRLKKISILKNGRAVCYANMHDSMNWQTVKLPYNLIIKPWDKIEVKVLEVFPEIRHARDASLAVTEIALTGKF